jgi:hypothetical protein
LGGNAVLAAAGALGVDDTAGALCVDDTAGALGVDGTTGAANAEHATNNIVERMNRGNLRMDRLR